MYNIILLSTMNIVFFGYLAICYVLFDPDTSISATFYRWNEKYRKIIFLGFCWGYAIPAIMMAHTGFLFFAGAFLTGVGIASDYKNDSNVSRDHTIAAVTAVVLSQLSIFFDYHLYWLNIASLSTIIVLFLLKNKFKTWMYWAEIVAFIAIDYVLYTEILIK